MRSLFSKHDSSENHDDSFESAMRTRERSMDTHGRKERILAMDDDAFIRGVIRAVLLESGYEICIAKNGVETIELFTEARDKGNSFDIVLLDLHLPSGLGGDGVLEMLRERDPQVRAILMTADINHPAVANYEAQGFKSVIIKPFTRQDLLQTIYHTSEISTENTENR